MPLNICILAAGAAGMYCGSCLRDNALAGSLMKLGHRVTLLPLYTPLRTDVADVSNGPIFYGGINVYLQHASRLFRFTPRVIDWLFDRPFLLLAAGSLGAGTHPSKLASLTRDILMGYNGPTHKELRRLIDFLAAEVKPDVITLPNLMFAGMAKAFSEKLKCPVICELTGEDIFLDAMEERDRENIRQIIRATTPYVARFVATSEYYANKMSAYLDIQREKIAVVYPGLPAEMLGESEQGTAAGEGETFRLTYLARICPEKGFDQLVEAFLHLQKLPGGENVHLHYAGYLAGQYRAWHHTLQQRVRNAGLGDRMHYHGAVDLAGKLQVLDRADLFCVPTTYAESKGIFVLEALARSVPVLAPDHGSFGELAELTKAIQLVAPHDPMLLAERICALAQNGPARRELAAKARNSVIEHFTSDKMAEKMLKIFEDSAKSGLPG